MRRLALCLCLLLAPFAWATPAQARGLDNLQAGLTGLLEFVFDPVMIVWQLPEDFEELPGHPYSSYVMAVPVGVVQAAHRAALGAFDVVMSPLMVFPVMSPEPRWELFEVDYEE